MPLPWFKLYRSRINSEDIQHLAALLEADGCTDPVPCARGLLASLLSLASLAAAEDGTLCRTDIAIDAAAGRKGSTSMLVEAHVIERVSEGVVHVVGWADENGEGAARATEKKDADRERKAKERERRRSLSAGRPTDILGTSDGRPLDGARTSAGRRRSDGDGDGDGDADEDADEDEDEPEMSRGEPSTAPSTIDETSERVAVPAPAPCPARELVARWNKLATELALPRCAKLTPQLRTRLLARIAEDALLARWDALAAALRASKFFRGDNDRGWRADVAWLSRPGKAADLIAQHEAAPKSGAQARAALPSAEVASEHADALARQTRARESDEAERRKIQEQENAARRRVLGLPRDRLDALRAEALRAMPPFMAQAEPAGGYSRSMIAAIDRLSGGGRA
jgi:hypothetical protein